MHPMLHTTKQCYRKDAVARTLSFGAFASREILFHLPSLLSCRAAKAYKLTFANLRMVGCTTFTTGRSSKAALGDEIPLNKSFDTQATSDTYTIAEDSAWSSTTNVMTVWGLRKCSQADDHDATRIATESCPRRTSFSSAETEKVRNTGWQGVVKRSWQADLAVQYSPSLGIAFESADGQEEIFHDEPEPRAIIIPQLPSSQPLPDEGKVELREEQQNPEFFNNMIAIRSDLNPRWQDIPPQAREEGNEVSAVDGAWRGTVEVAATDEESDVASASFDEARARARAALERASGHQDSNCSEIVWTASGCNDRKTRRRISFTLFFILAMVVSTGILIGTLVGGGRGSTVVQNPENSNEWIGDLPEDYPTEKSIEPVPAHSTASPTRASTVAAVTVTSTPSVAPFAQTKRPVLDTVPPDMPSPTQPPRQPSPSVVAIGVPQTAQPTKQPTRQIPTASPTEQRPAPTPRPTDQSVQASPQTTQRPSTAPVSSNDAPMQCRSSLTVDKNCYVEESDEIVIELVNCDPQNDDWVGIWLNSEDPENLSDNFLTWAWSCGSRSCLGAPSTMRMAFEAKGLGSRRLRAFLVHEQPKDAPYSSQTMSEAFAVTDRCSR